MSSPTSTTRLTEDRRRALLAEREQLADRKIKLPDVVSFDELFDVIAFWDHSLFNHENGVRSPGYPEGARVTLAQAMPDIGKPARQVSVEVGPYCNISRQPTKARYGLAVTPKQVVLDELRGWMMGDPNESWSFEVIDHGEVALVIANNSLAITGVWLAYIDPATIPAPESFIHKAQPSRGVADEEAGVGHCYTCGQPVKRVPGGQGSTWVHTDSGAVAAPNPPKDPPRILPEGDRPSERAFIDPARVSVSSAPLFVTGIDRDPVPPAAEAETTHRVDLDVSESDELAAVVDRAKAEGGYLHVEVRVPPAAQS